MKAYKWIALIAGAAGYVLGTKAGRTRYEQIRRATQKVTGDPRVRDVAHQAQEQVAHAAEKVRHHGDDVGTPSEDAMMGR